MDWWRWAIATQLQPACAFAVSSAHARMSAMDALQQALLWMQTTAASSDYQHDVARVVTTTLRLAPHVLAHVHWPALHAMAALLDACLCSPATVGALPGSAQASLLQHALVRRLVVHASLRHSSTQTVLKSAPASMVDLVVNAVCERMVNAINDPNTPPPESLLTGVLTLLDADLPGLSTRLAAVRSTATPLSTALLAAATDPAAPASHASLALQLAARLGIEQGAVVAALTANPAAGAAFYHRVPNGIHAWLLTSAHVASLLALLGPSHDDAVAEARGAVVEDVFANVLTSLQLEHDMDHQNNGVEFISHMLEPLADLARAAGPVDAGALPGPLHRALRRLLRLLGGVLRCAPSVLEGEHAAALLQAYAIALATRYPEYL